MTRIIAGIAGGRRLRVPRTGTRPTTDRVREAIYSSLDAQLHAAGREWAGLRVLDLFAGSGALGLEALSRGASAVLLVERQAGAAQVLQENVESVGLAGATVLRRDVHRLAADPPPGGGFHLCLVDPPYALPASQVADLLQGLADAGWLQHDCLLVVEASAARVECPLPTGSQEPSMRTYGDTAVWYGHIASAGSGRG